MMDFDDELEKLLSNTHSPKFNGGECGEDCNCIEIETAKHGFDVKSYPCLGGKFEQSDELKI